MIGIIECKLLKSCFLNNFMGEKWKFGENPFKTFKKFNCSTFKTFVTATLNSFHKFSSPSLAHLPQIANFKVKVP